MGFEDLKTNEDRFKAEAARRNADRSKTDKLFGKNVAHYKDVAHEEASKDNEEFDRKKSEDKAEMDTIDNEAENIHLDLKETQLKSDRERITSQAEDFEGKMKKKTAELIGSSSEEANVVGLALERNMIREQLLKNGLLAEKDLQTINSYVRSSGDYAQRDLSSFKETNKMETIDSEAVDLEKKALDSIKDCESGWTDPKKFFEAFQNEIDAVKIKKTSESAGMETTHKTEAGFENIKEAALGKKKEIFGQMLKAPDNLLNFSQKEWKRRLQQATMRGDMTEDQYIEQTFNNPAFKETLNSDLTEFHFNTMDKNFKGYETVYEEDPNGRRAKGEIGSHEAAARKTLLKAEILGIS
jgi:hypothetical protein